MVWLGEKIAKSPDEAERRLRTLSIRRTRPAHSSPGGYARWGARVIAPRPVSPPRSIREEAQGSRSSHSRGYTPLFLSNGAADRWRRIERRAPMQAMSERAGLDIRKAGSRLSAPSALSAFFSYNYTKMSSRWAAAANLALPNYRMARRKASSRLRGCASLDHSQTSRVPFC